MSVAKVGKPKFVELVISEWSVSRHVDAAEGGCGPVGRWYEKPAIVK